MATEILEPLEYRKLHSAVENAKAWKVRVDTYLNQEKGKCYRLYAPELWARVDPKKSKFKVKAEKEQLVLILQKVSTEAIHSMWESLRRN